MLQARLAVLEYIRGCGDDVLDGRFKWQDGVLNARCKAGCVPFMEVWWFHLSPGCIFVS